MIITARNVHPSQRLTRDCEGPHSPPLFNNMRHTRLPGSGWEVSPGYHLWGERKSGEQNALPLLVTGDRQARKPANDGIPHTAVEVLTELANDLVSGAGRTHRFTDAASMRRHWKSTEGKTMAYYKTSDAGVLAAWKAYRESADRLQVQGEEFAKRFVGATALFQTSMHSGRNFYGLKFNPPMPQPLWTKPDPKADSSQFPRSSLPSGTKGEERKALKLELQKLQEEFKEHKPKDKADLQPFLDAMGLGGGSLLFSSYKHVVTPDCIYVSTSAKPNGVMTEILGSEFEAAEAANN